jgi:hypothetical protein
VAAVSLSDAKAATESLGAVAVNKNVQMAAILRNGAVFARFDRRADTAGTSVLMRVAPELIGAPRAVFTSRCAPSIFERTIETRAGARQFSRRLVVFFVGCVSQFDVTPATRLYTPPIDM